MPPSNQRDEDWHFDVPEPDDSADDEREPEPETKRLYVSRMLRVFGASKQEDAA